MSYPIDLSITGKPSPRTEHPGSAGRKRTPLNENKSRNQRSSIFGGECNNRVPDHRKLKSDNKKVTSEIGQVKISSSRKTAPKGVPQLSLDDVVEKEDDLRFSKLPQRTPQLDSPTSNDTYSWGTPLNNVQGVKGGGWQVNQSRKGKKPVSSQRKHEDVPDLELNLSQTNEGLAQLRKAAKQASDDIQFEYLGADKKKLEALKKLGHGKKLQFVDQTVLLDQLDNVHVTEEKPPSPKPQFGVHDRFDSRTKRHRDLHSTSTTPFGNSEVDLSKRLQFGARVLSLNGHDARREINGFYFLNDKTITMYEFRQFGTRSNALPFIQRGNYVHLHGSRKGKAYSILDISAGKDLAFVTEHQSSLPDTLKTKQTASFRITEVDEENKNKLLYDGCKTLKDRALVDDMIRTYKQEEMSETIMLLTNIQENIRKLLKSRGAKTMTSLHNHFKKIDRSGDGLLSKEELQAALKQFRINIQSQDFEKVWDIVDRNKDGVLDYGEFVRGFFGEMTEVRKKWVQKAFTRMDPNKSGSATIDDLRKFFCASRHPDVVKGQKKSSEVIEEIVDIFQSTRNKREFPYSEFEAYYEGVSMGIALDDEFVNLIRSSWTV